MIKDEFIIFSMNFILDGRKIIGTNYLNSDYHDLYMYITNSKINFNDNINWKEKCKQLLNFYQLKCLCNIFNRYILFPLKNKKRIIMLDEEFFITNVSKLNDWVKKSKKDKVCEFIDEKNTNILKNQCIDYIGLLLKIFKYTYDNSYNYYQIISSLYYHINMIGNELVDAIIKKYNFVTIEESLLIKNSDIYINYQDGYLKESILMDSIDDLKKVIKYLYKKKLLKRDYIVYKTYSNFIINNKPIPINCIYNRERYEYYKNIYYDFVFFMKLYYQ